ncbi:MAG: hypothetical protein JWN04_834 [Myxococcaceae bacterium]|nr:hypothetical protein [Myxococcaceae bacterium]
MPVLSVEHACNLNATNSVADAMVTTLVLESASSQFYPRFDQTVYGGAHISSNVVTDKLVVKGGCFHG